MVRELEWGSWWGPGRKGGELVGELVRSRDGGAVGEVQGKRGWGFGLVLGLAVLFFLMGFVGR